jgi:ribosome-associated protein
MTPAMGEARSARTRLTAEQKLAVVEEAVLSLRAVSPVVLDLRELTVITDYFLVCHGTSTTHIRAIADRVMERMEEQGLRPAGMEGYAETQWILLDYGDVVVHVFAEEQREFYALERLWSDAPRADLAPPDEGADDR